ncbi:MAG: DNA-protecting protein DprA, partial [Rhodobacteraceae bacterium]|nr:DNA-protecting protein DprA [Paracoccaceae bacterium]
ATHLGAAPALPAPTGTVGLPARLLDLLGPSPTSEDLLIRATGAASAEVAAALLDLEIDGRIARHPGGLYSRPPA